MTTEEFSNGFDTLVNSYTRFKAFDEKEYLDSVEFDEYEKSYFLTKAQEYVIISCYNGKNVGGESFESSEEARVYLRSLIKEFESLVEEDDTCVFAYGTPWKAYRTTGTYPTRHLFTTAEYVTTNLPDSCKNGKQIAVVPASHDEWATLKDNPFRGPSDYRVLRMDDGDVARLGCVPIHLISKYPLSTYSMWYIQRPAPIVLENLPEGLTVDGVSIKTECTVHSALHETILDQAVRLALASKSIAVKTDTK